MCTLRQAAASAGPQAWAVTTQGRATGGTHVREHVARKGSPKPLPPPCLPRAPGLLGYLKKHRELLSHMQKGDEIELEQAVSAQQEARRVYQASQMPPTTCRHILPIIWIIMDVVYM